MLTGRGSYYASDGVIGCYYLRDRESPNIARWRSGALNGVSRRVRLCSSCVDALAVTDVKVNTNLRLRINILMIERQRGSPKGPVIHQAAPIIACLC